MPAGRARIEELIALIENLVRQACSGDHRTCDSMAISAYADAMCFLARRGRFVIEQSASAA